MSDNVARRLRAERKRLLDVRAGLAVPEDEPSPDAGGDLHPADVASELFDRSKDLSILQGVDLGLQEVERAEERLRAGNYGICEACGEPIATGRLQALPAARFCRDDQARAERMAGSGRGQAPAVPLSLAG